MAMLYREIKLLNIQEKKKLSRWYRANLWIHRWVSLVIALPFAILCITGLILIFHEEVDHLLGHTPKVEYVHVQESRPLIDSLEVVKKAYPNEKVISTTIDPEHLPGMMIIGMAKEGAGFNDARWLYADIAQAKLVDQPDFDKTFTGFLLELHAQWFLGITGEIIGALIALLVLLSLISGVVVYAPYIRKFLFGIIRFRKGKRLLQLDLHNLIGSVVLGWAFVVTLTGVLLGLGTVAIGLWQMTELSELQQKYQHNSLQQSPPANIDQIYTSAAQAAKNWQPTIVLFPGTEYSTQQHYMVLMEGARAFDKNMLQLALIDANTFQVAEILQLPLYLKAILVSQPLHYGDYGGMPLKLVWSICTLFTLFITINGAWLWWAKRKKIH